MSSKPVAEKLGIKAGDKVLLLHAPEDYQDILGAVPDGCEMIASPARNCDIVQVFVRDTEMFDDNIQTAFESTDSEGRLWITYPKKSSTVDSDLSRDGIAERMDQLGWRGARQIAVDETWSAIWFRPKE